MSFPLWVRMFCLDAFTLEMQGHATGQTTGIGGHVAARFIPTVERESVDLVYVRSSSLSFSFACFFAVINISNYLSETRMFPVSFPASSKPCRHQRITDLSPPSLEQRTIICHRISRPRSIQRRACWCSRTLGCRCRVSGQGRGNRRTSP